LHVSRNEPRAALRGRPLPFLLLLAAAIAGGAALLLRGGGGPDRPPVLVVTLDTVRDDAVGPGTPALEALARRGVRFRGARTPVPLTLPAHATLFSGLEPPRHGLRDNASPALPKARVFPLLAEEFAARGYATAAFVASGVLDPRFGLDAGFQRYDRPLPGAPGETRFREIPAEEQVRRATQWLEARPKDRPFFLWVHFFDPHEYYEAWPGDERRAGTDDSDPPAERYAGEVRRVDAAVERLLAALPPGTVVLVAGDHGESLGEHGEATHGHLLHGATMEIPLILAGPGVAEGREDSRVASLADAAPTLRALAGLDPRPGDGRDLLAPPAGRVVCGESLLPHRAYGWAQQSCATDGRFLLLDGGPRLALYDLGADPGERTPLEEPRRHEAFESLDRALDAYRGARVAGAGAAGGEALDVQTPYGSDRIATDAFLSPAENRRLPDAVAMLPRLAALYQLTAAIEAGAQGASLLVPLLAAAEDAEAKDPTNPAWPLHRGRALRLLDRPREALLAFEESWRRGYRTGPVGMLRVDAAFRAGDAPAAARAVEEARASLPPAEASRIEAEKSRRFR